MKQKDEDTTKNLLFLCEGQDEASVREIMQKYGIIILSLENYTETAAQFGNISLYIERESQQYQIVINSESYEEACKTFLEAGCKVTSINDTSNTLSSDQSAQIIATVKKEVMFEMEEERKRKEAETQKEEANFVSNSREKLRGIVSQTFEDIAHLREKLTGSPHVSGADFKQLADFEEELKKLRMGSNSDKITQLLQEIFTLMEKLEIQHLDALKEEERQGIVATSFVSDLDVAGELDKFKKAERVKTAGTAKTADDNYYIFFGKGGMYLKLLGKELKSKIKRITKISKGLVHYIEYTSLFFAICLGAIIFYNQANGLPSPDTIFILFVYAGVAGLAITLGSIITTKNIVVTLLRLGTSFALYILLINFVVTNFALQ